MLIVVSGIPTLANSKKVMLSPLPALSACWMIIILLAAPRIKRFPAIVEPAASAINSLQPASADRIRGKNSATMGTFDIN